MTDGEITQTVKAMMHKMLGYNENEEPDIIHIFRHERAIPQYEISTGERLETIEKLENQYPGLILAGNIRDGIGMADRIRQAVRIANDCCVCN